MQLPVSGESLIVTSMSNNNMAGIQQQFPVQMGPIPMQIVPTHIIQQQIQQQQQPMQQQQVQQVQQLQQVHTEILWYQL